MTERLPHSLGDALVYPQTLTISMHSLQGKVGFQERKTRPTRSEENQKAVKKPQMISSAWCPEHVPRPLRTSASPLSSTAGPPDLPH